MKRADSRATKARFLTLVACIAVCAVLPPAAAREARPQTTLAIVGADVLPMTGRDRLADQTVVVDGDRIVGVGPESALSVPPRAKIIDGHGLTLMPGLVDMHVHLPHATGAPGDDTQRALAVMLAYGVTTARDMQGAPNDLIARAAVEQGELPGPRIYVATKPLNDDNTRTPEEARTAVREAKRLGYDLIKLHNINDLRVWQAAADEAREEGLPTAGHVTQAVGLDRALATGQEVEHLDGSFSDLLASASPPRDLKFGQLPPPEVMRTLARTTDAQVRALAERVASARSVQVPTLAAFEAVVTFDRPTSQLARKPQMQFVPASVIRTWTATREALRTDGLLGETREAFIQLRRQIVRAFADAGVPIMVGSDTPQNFEISGPGLLRELKALRAAGLSNMQVLKSATVVPRDYLRTLPNGGSALGWKAEFGTVEPGARADLILLRGDPSTDLSALDHLDSVIAGGRLYDRRALDGLLADAAAAANPKRGARKSTTKSPFEPIIAQVAAALDGHQLVGIGDDGHRRKQAHELQMALLHDPRVLCRIDAVAVEFGNGALQQIADRYVSGESVPLDEKRRMWRDTGQWLVWDSPIYEQFFDAVRSLNQRRICPRPVRVLLADPPIDWAKVHSVADYRHYRIRDEYFASVVEREVLAKGGRALIIAGDSHLWKALPEKTAEKARLGMLIEQSHPGTLVSYTFVPDVDHPAKAKLPAAPSLTLLQGTDLGRRSFSRLMPADDTLLMKVGGKEVETPLNKVAWPPAEQMVDGLLNLGTLTEVRPNPAIYRGAYLAELRRRAPIMKGFYGFDFTAILENQMRKCRR